MSLRFVLDEHLRGPAWSAVCRHNATGESALDVVRVGDADGLPLGVDDAAILLWAEQEGRILVTRDQSTMKSHLERHLDAGHRSPGVFMIRPHGQLSAVIEFLILADQLSDPHEWQDAITYIG
jgi:hypothetical protein